MRFMFAYPQYGSEGDMLAAGAVSELAKTAEASGWHGMAFTDHPAPGATWLAQGGHQSLDPFIALGNAAAVTSQLKLHTHLAVGPYRNPLLLAKSAATVDKLSNGRMILGLGAGYLRKEFNALGVSFDERNALMDELLDVLPLHWSGKPFSYEGMHFSARELQALPAPVQQPIPVWIGGNSTRSLRRVAESGCGWIPLIGPKDLSGVVRTPVISGLTELREKITRLMTLWQENNRSGKPDILIPFPEAIKADSADLSANATQYRDTLSELSAMGITWVFVPGLGNNPDNSAVVHYLETVGRQLISA
ncbi:MAG TPA: LLM class F420-dependent oxidoreductase [Spongiibacteraceae bacterium]|nr:LLM class F420-dependent oxidoreductase [Spongiibacteraceae bacterium]HCS26196.1 LLM class F420-dependent oxidoreductase [Spongiibacteraceae bacterium]